MIQVHWIHLISLLPLKNGFNDHTLNLVQAKHTVIRMLKLVTGKKSTGKP